MKNTVLTIIFLLAQVANALENGVTDSEILIGGHTCESGPFAVFASISRASTAFFDQVNAQGGIHGRKIKFTRIDTLCQQPKAIEATKKLVEQDKVFAVFGSVSGSHQAVYKYLIEKNVPDVFFSDGISEFAKPVKKNIFPGQIPFTTQGGNLAKVAVEKYKGKKACFFIPDTQSGEDFLSGAKEVLDAENLKLKDPEKIKFGAIEKFERLAVQANANVTNLKRDGCELVLTSAVGTLAPASISYGILQGFKPTWFVMTQNATDNFLKLLPEGSRDGIVANIGVLLDKSENPKAWTAYEDLMTKNSVPVSALSLEGYVEAELFAEAVQRAGKNLTRESFYTAIESIHDWTCTVCNGPMTYSATNHWGRNLPKSIISKSGKWEKLKP